MMHTWFEVKIRYEKMMDNGMKGTMADYQIASVAETAIMDVYPYVPEEKKEE